MGILNTVIKPREATPDQLPAAGAAQQDARPAGGRALPKTSSGGRGTQHPLTLQPSAVTLACFYLHRDLNLGYVSLFSRCISHTVQHTASQCR